MELIKSIEIYTDGSLMKKKNGTYCGYSVYFPNNEYGKQIGRKFKHEPITNNRAELYAILKAIKLANIINKRNNNSVEKINIYSDSEYAVNSINIWLENWRKKSKPYANADIIDQIDLLIGKVSFIVSIIHINSHTGLDNVHSIGNNFADKLAKKGAMR